MEPFAAYIPVGPRDVDIPRAVDLIHSLFHYEPATPHILILDDSLQGDTDWYALPIPRTCTLHVVRHPRTDRQFNDRGGVCTANLVAFRALERLDLSFILKLDTDALVIGPCAADIHDRFLADPGCALLGTLGHSSNRAVRSFHGNDELLYMAMRAVKISSRLDCLRADDLEQLREWHLDTEEQQLALASAALLFLRALDSGFDGHHCQGGAYAISGAFTRCLSDTGMLDDPLLWMDLPFNEDRLMALCAAAVGLKAGDFSEYGEPFAVQAWGLPYSPADLIERGHSLTHSVRNDTRHSEQDIRRFFRNRRESVGCHS